MEIIKHKCMICKKDILETYRVKFWQSAMNNSDADYICCKKCYEMLLSGIKFISLIKENNNG